MNPFFHVGIVVEDIDKAMAELGTALGLTWRVPHESTYGDHTIKVTYSVAGPPYIELIEGGQGGPWDVSKGSHMHHIGLWTDDVPGGCQKLVEAGLPVSFDPRSVGKPATYCYHMSPATGTRIELLDVSAKPRIEGKEER